MSRLILRPLSALLGVSAILWAANVIPVESRNHPIAEVANSVWSGQRYSLAQLRYMLQQQVDAIPSEQIRASAQNGAMLIRLILFENERKTADHEPQVVDSERLQDRVEEAIAQAPTNPFMWLSGFWLDRVSGKATERDWNLLRMSYQSGPNEAWVALVRSPQVLNAFSSLPHDLAEMAVREFVGLVRSGLYEDAANIMAGAPPAVRNQLLSRLAGLQEEDRRAFAKALEPKDLPDVAVPGVDKRPDHPF